MARVGGVPLAELFELSSEAVSLLPQRIRDFFNRFSAIELASTRSAGAIIHHGRLQALLDSVDSSSTGFDIGIGTLSIPLLHSGVPFQLSMVRAAIAGNLEPAAAAWKLDIALASFVLTLDGLEPAIYVAETGTVPRHLVRDPNLRDVRIIGSAVLQIDNPGGGAALAVRFIHESDPIDPAIATGAVASITVSPPHFFFGSSQFGMTVRKLEYDFSTLYSSPEVLERNQGPQWTGLAIQEATIYAPRNLPHIGDLSGGVKDVLIGDPLGIQGTLEIQFGRTALDPSTFRFRKEGTATELAATGTGTSRVVTIQAGQEETFLLHAGFMATAPPEGGALDDWSAEWRWPGSTAEGGSSSGLIRHGQVLRVVPQETITVDGNEETVRHPEVSFRIVAGGTGPSVSVAVSNKTLQNVVHLNGTAAAIVNLTLTAVSNATPAGTFEWEIPSKQQRVPGTTFSPDFTGLSGQHFIVLRERPAGTGEPVSSRIRVQLADTSELLIGCENGVFRAATPAVRLPLTAVETTYDLSDFHGQAAFNTLNEQATLDSSKVPGVAVPPDGLAQVVVEEGGAPAVPPAHDRHVQVLMRFEESEVVGWGNARPRGASASASERDIQSQLLEWASHYPGSTFIVIGRCDDIGEDIPGEGPDAFNIALASGRGEKGTTLLTQRVQGSTGSLIAASRVVHRGEFAAWAGASAQGDMLEEDAALALAPEEKSEAAADANMYNGWLIKNQHEGEYENWVNAYDTSRTYEEIRKQYRRADIYAVQGTPTSDAVVRDGVAETAPDRRRSFVPAAGRTPLPVTAPSPKIDYRVKLVLGWDKPTASGWRDAIPNLAEAEFAWTPQSAPLPNVGGTAVDVSREVLTVYGKWVHDENTGFTRTTLGIKSDGDPNGLFHTTNKQLTVAAAFAPVLLSGVNSQTDLIETGARLTALVGLTAFADADMGDGRKLVGAGTKTAVMCVEAEAQTRTLSDPGAAYQIKLVADYVCTLHFDTGPYLGLKTAADRPMKVRYKKVGLVFDNTKPGWDKLGLAFDTRSIEIEDPGKWQIEGTLGELLRIVEIEFGQGSVWIEGRIAIALNIGVVEISEAILRFTFEDGNPRPRFELRGFVVKANIPGVLEGEGRLRLEEGGIVRAGVEAKLVPLDLSVTAGIAFGKPPEIDPDIFLSLFLGVQFATPLPLANTGAAIYGFKGMFVMNGSRELPINSDPIGRELQWWGTPPEQKYGPERGQFALGVGVVVGTLPDVSFCFSASGMLVVAFPDPEVILGVDVNIVQVPDTEVRDQDTPSGTITGLIVIDSEAVKVAVSARYEIPALLKLIVPFGAYFPYSLVGAYVRIGSDGQTAHGRYGEPVTLTLLPGSLDARAWAYLMIEQGGLQSLGGDPRFSFDGFSVGFGTGFAIEWSAGPIKLSASAKLLAGFGTKPLLVKGGIFVNGELDLVAVSISARGELIFTYLDENVYLKGEFCGEVDLFFFSLEGCVGVDIGTQGAIAHGPPEPPVAAVMLTDRKDRIMGGAPDLSVTLAGQAIFKLTDVNGKTVNQGVPPAANHTVWPDTAVVLQFKHFVAKSANSAAYHFEDGSWPSMPEWFGSNKVKYAYRLDDVILRKKGGAPIGGGGKVEACWTTTPYRQPDSSGANGNPIPSEQEGPALKLLDWNPWSWVVNMGDGGANTGGNPAQEVENLCEPLPMPRRACVFGRSAKGSGLHHITIRQEQPAPPPYPSRFHVTGEPALIDGSTRVAGGGLVSLLAQGGFSVVPGGIRGLAQPVTSGGTSLASGYRFPAARRADANGLTDVALPWEGRFDRDVMDPQVLLLVCDALAQSGGGEKICDEFKDVKTGARLQALERRHFYISPADSADAITTNDSLDASGDPVKHGGDGAAELLIPHGGLDIKFKALRNEVEIHVFAVTSEPLSAEILDGNGQTIESRSIPAAHETPVLVRFASLGGIHIARIAGGGGKSLVYRICHGGPDGKGEGEKECESFRALKPIDDRISAVTHNGFAIRTLDSRSNFALSDAVDQSGPRALPGSDGGAEIMFPDSGIGVKLPRSCMAIEVHLMLFAGKPVEVIALDAAGIEIEAAKSADLQGEHLTVSLGSQTGAAIAGLYLIGGAGEAALFRLCCTNPNSGSLRCVDFAALQLREGDRQAFEHQGLKFAGMDNGAHLELVDFVSFEKGEGVAGQDGLQELLLPAGGLAITLPQPCQEARLSVLAQSGAITIEAVNAIGARVDQAEAKGGAEKVQHFSLAAEDIRAINLFGGDGNAVLSKICFRASGVEGARVAARDMLGLRAAAERERGLAVTGMRDGKLADGWETRIVGAASEGEGRRCQVILCTPAREEKGSWSGFYIAAPRGKEVTLLSVCAIDKSAMESRAAGQQSRGKRAAEVTEQANTPPNQRRDVLLARNTAYEIEVRWSYQKWESPGENSATPPSTSSGTWIAGDTQRFHFRTASEDLNHPTTQDGLNEHVFDPRDVVRYLLRVEPADGRSAHFFGDPVWVHFDSGHIEELLDKYGWELAIEVKRTDPPPQPTPELLDDLTAPLVGNWSWLTAPAVLNPVGYQLINAAVLDAPCLPNGPVVGGASIAASFPLEPNAMYDFNLVAKQTNGNRRQLISGTRFRTSRYKSGAALVAALGFNTGSPAPFPAEDIILPAGAVLPTGPLETSDALLGQLMSAIGADTLPLPQFRPETYLVWRLDQGAWRVEGLLVDSLESLNREGAVAAGGGSDIKTTFKLTGASVGANGFSVHRANAAWTRVFLKANAPFSPPAENGQLVLRFQTASGTLSGARRITSLPRIVVTEGLDG